MVQQIEIEMLKDELISFSIKFHDVWDKNKGLPKESWIQFYHIETRLYQIKELLEKIEVG